MSASLALQIALRGLLTADAVVTALIPAGSIFDRSARPEAFPCIILGEATEVPADHVVQRYTRVVSTVHVWQREAGLTGVKEIAGAIRKAVNGTYPVLDGGRCLDLRFTGARFMRDPDGVTSHGVMTFEAVVEELA
jgi:hypothetical protein